MNYDVRFIYVHYSIIYELNTGMELEFKPKGAKV